MNSQKILENNFSKKKKTKRETIFASNTLLCPLSINKKVGDNFKLKSILNLITCYECKIVKKKKNLISYILKTTYKNLQ